MHDAAAGVVSIGEQPVNLDPFRTIVPPPVTGLAPERLLDSYDAERRPVAWLYTNASAANAQKVRADLRPPAAARLDGGARSASVRPLSLPRSRSLFP